VSFYRSEGRPTSGDSFRALVYRWDIDLIGYPLACIAAQPHDKHQASTQRAFHCPTLRLQSAELAVSPVRTPLVVHELAHRSQVNRLMLQRSRRVLQQELHRACHFLRAHVDESRAGAEAGHSVLDLAILLRQGWLKLGQACHEMVRWLAVPRRHAMRSRDRVGIYISPVLRRCLRSASRG
jgi:hypothetical protein